MFARMVNYFWPTNAGTEPGVPIKNFGDELAGHDTYSKLVDYWSGVETGQPSYTTQDPVQQLFAAAKEGDLAAVKDFIENQQLPVDSVILYGNYTPQSVKTPLREALVNYQWEVARYLVDQNADVNFQEIPSGRFYGDQEIPYDTYDHVSPLMIVSYCLKEHREQAEPLFKYMVEEKGGDLNARDCHGYTILHNAVSSDNNALFDYCLAHGAIIGEAPRGVNGGSHSALYLAAMYNRLDMAEELLKCGAHVEGANERGHSTPLSNAAYQGKSRVEMMQLLINNGADVNFPGHNGNTPLKNAVTAGNVEHARLLLENGAEMDVKDWMYHQSAEDFVNRAKSSMTTNAFDGTPYPVEEMQALFKEFKAKRAAELMAQYSSSEDFSSRSSSGYEASRDSDSEIDHEVVIRRPGV